MTTITKADQQAAERVLKAAVRRAVAHYRTAVAFGGESDRAVITPWVVAMLTAAGESAALLLDERPAKKAAARKGAS